MQSLRSVRTSPPLSSGRTFPQAPLEHFSLEAGAAAGNLRADSCCSGHSPYIVGAAGPACLGGHHVSLQPGISRGAQRSASGVVSCWHTGPYLSRLKGLLPNLRAPASTKTSNKAGLAQLTSLSPVQSGLRAPRERQKGAGVPKPEKTPCKNLKLYRESEEVIL